MSGYGCRSVRSAHVVGVVGPGSIGWRHWRTPSEAVNFVVVGVSAVEHRVVEAAGEGVVGRHRPVEVRRRHRAAESQILCRAVHAVAVWVEEPDAGKVDRHVYFLAGVGIVAIQPYFIVFAVDGLGPNLIDDNVCCKLIFISAVYHKLVLGVEGCSHTFCLWTREVTYGVC